VGNRVERVDAAGDAGTEREADNAEYSSEDPGERARLRLSPRSDVGLAVGARQSDGLDAEAGHLHVLHDHRRLLLLGLGGDGVGWQRRIDALLL